jgi:Leucine-rich repeat (LRR) protein
LKELWLHNNALTSLPPLIGNLKDLSVLTLSCNKLRALPAGYGGIGGCANLCELWLKENPLDGIPPEIGLLTKLKVLLLP